MVNIFSPALLPGGGIHWKMFLDGTLVVYSCAHYSNDLTSLNWITTFFVIVVY